jgi:two-component system LytT family response regulator
MTGMTERLRVVIADDERPARSLLRAMLLGFPDVNVVGEAVNGSEAVEVIERTRPDLALLDLHMPEVDGLGVVRLLRKDRVPLIAFVTAYDQYAVRAFDLNAVDYLLKPVDPARLRETLNRAQDRLERDDERGTARGANLQAIRALSAALETRAAEPLLRIPVRKRDQIILVPVEQIASIIADGELLHLFTAKNEKHTISYRLKDLESRLDTAPFIRLSRGTIANVAMIERVAPMTGGTYVVVLSNGQQLPVSRIRSRILRDRLLRL